jgi:hypothetical protein
MWIFSPLKFAKSVKVKEANNLLIAKEHIESFSHFLDDQKEHLESLSFYGMSNFSPTIIQKIAHLPHLKILAFSKTSFYKCKSGGKSEKLTKEDLKPIQDAHPALKIVLE